MRRRRSLLLAAAASAAAVVLAAPATAVATPAPGAPGIGDPYYPTYGNGGYDVSHYTIVTSYDPATDRLRGTTAIAARATQDLSRFDLDFALTTTAVLVDGEPATTSTSGTELVVTPRRPIRRGEPLDVLVTYTGIPSQVTVNGLKPWVRTPDGAVAVGEPEIAAWWFPSNDHPRDKATYDIVTTVPAGVEVVSNGLLTAHATHGGRSVWAWRETKPMATYLAFVAIGQYDITHGVTSDGVPWLNAFSTGLDATRGPAARTSVGHTPQILDWETRLFGPYPFETAGGVVPSADFGFALENQTRPVYSPEFWRDGAPYDSVVVHELAHQWFGDSVSVHNWRDIWLNEGFASIAEWLYTEDHGGPTAQQTFDMTYLQHPADDTFWKVPIGDPGVANLFSDPVYDRGAMALQALRNRIGDATFRRTLRDWAQRKRYGNGSIPEFVALSEQESGTDLGDFFQTWLYTPAKPAPTSENGIPASSPATVHHVLTERAALRR
jgi:aminopeptidase N